LRAIGVLNYGGPEQLGVLELPDPEPGPGEVRIRVHAAAVNPADTVSREGLAGRLDHRHLPHVPGIEGAGVVELIGPGADGRLSEGQRVMMLVLPFERNRGSYAEWVVVPADCVVPMPGSMDFNAAATLLMNALTARMMLDRLNLSPGQILAVTGAAGVLGCYTVEMAKSDGLCVIADASPTDVDLVRSCGADHVVQRGDDVADRIRAIVPDGVPALADCAIMHGLISPAVADGGRIACIRRWEGPRSPRNIVTELVHVSTRAGDTEALEEIARLATKGILTPRVARVLPVTEAAQAHRMLAAGGIRGRLVLDLATGRPPKSGSAG
jgi:NADPH:quinone reductase-like Zn-dependent oxidoreductase